VDKDTITYAGVCLYVVENVKAVWKINEGIGILKGKIESK